MEKGLKLPLLVPEEEMDLSFIPMKEALIGWNPVENKERGRTKERGRKIELKVFLWNEEERKKYIIHPSDYFFAASGVCSYDWTQFTVPQVICECWRILIDYPMLNQKESLLEFSKIEELEDLRKMTFESFFSDEYLDDYEEFLFDHFGKS